MRRTAWIAYTAPAHQYRNAPHSAAAHPTGSVIAAMATPDMRIPIAHCLAWPHRLDVAVPRLDLAALSTLSFEKPDTDRFPALALARAVGASKAAMADVREAERATGYVAGGISPFGQKRAHRTVVDETVELWDTVYVSGGRRGLDVEIAPADLVEVTGAIVADIGRD